MKTWGKIFKKKRINPENSRQDTYRLVANADAIIDDKPKLVLEIEDTGVARTKLEKSTTKTASVGEMVKSSYPKYLDKISLHPMVIGVFFFLITFYFLAVIKLSIDIPKTFKLFEGCKKLDDTDKINLVLSNEGLVSFNLIPIAVFLLLGVFVHSLEDIENTKYLKGLWRKTVTTSVTALAVLVTIFSIWS